MPSILRGRVSTLCVSGLFALAGSGGSPAWAQLENANVMEKTAAPSAEAQAVLRSHLASDVAAYGRENRNVTALIVAAEMLLEIEGSATSEPEFPYSVDNLLADARSIAAADADLQVAIDRIALRLSELRRSAPVQRDSAIGVVFEPLTVFADVDAKATASHPLRFLVGQEAVVSVLGYGTGDLDLIVYDDGGIAICTDTNPSERSLCKWTPRRTAVFRVDIVSLGGAKSRYRLKTN